eukprot:CAMPEP_0117675650 /NCGR_PEP_ID=MMETSP0804-20121206/15728_1 /TAXON_ID=1074897 /ORGANISM="Tetraselmis astigmatica, Strain CCMP880" /LENGTH=151 /DNA_ID=CAMNT_0005484687 /DNA_START=8 /DNA_END=464 /DNA_ORIENTATION=-
MMNSRSLASPTFHSVAFKARSHRVRSGRPVSVRAEWTKAASTAAFLKLVVELSVGRVLLAEVEGAVYAVSNKCSHLGLPLVGKTGLFQAEIKDKCVVCPAHGTAFDLATGDVKGEWCPSLPNLPIVGKGPKQKPLPAYPCRVEGDDIEVDI